MLVKNVRLESVVELYSDDGSGGGQEPLNQQRNHFSDAGPSLDKDIEILNSLPDVGSFDVYTLRIALRELDIGFDQQDCLQLSQAKRRGLTRYMTVFTRPLIQRIYGPANQKITDMSDIFSLFTHPDRGQAVEQIHHVAEALGISVDEVPRFLETYGDMFLSIAYYRQCFDRMKCDLRTFLPWAEEVCESPAARATPSSNTRQRHR